jgi:hypothetical protein
MFACGEHVRTSKGNAWQQQQQQQPTNPRAQPYLKMCVWGGGWGILSAMFVNSVAAGLSKHELINYAFRAACTAHLIPQNN